MIIITLDYGRLGNRLIVFSHALSYALERNLSIINLCFKPFAPAFVGTAQPHFLESIAPENRDFLRVTVSM